MNLILFDNVYGVYIEKKIISDFYHTSLVYKSKDNNTYIISRSFDKTNHDENFINDCKSSFDKLDILYLKNLYSSNKENVLVDYIKQKLPKSIFLKTKVIPTKTERQCRFITSKQVCSI